MKNLTEQVPSNISLRDYFAAQAMAGLLSSVKDYECSTKEIYAIVETAYEIADVMIDMRTQT